MTNSKPKGQNKKSKSPSVEKKVGVCKHEWYEDPDFADGIFMSLKELEKELKKK